MDNKVALSFDKSLTNLAGFDYGKEVFEEQVHGRIDFNKAFYIVFPDQIQNIASSFVQGFFCNIVETIGLLATEERVKIISNNGLEENIMKKLY